MFQNICLVFFAIPNTCKTRTRTGVKKRQTIQTNREHSTSGNRKTHKYTHTERTKKHVRETLFRFSGHVLHQCDFK